MENSEGEPLMRRRNQVPLVIEVLVVLLLAVIPDVYIAFQQYLEPVSSSFAEIHSWMIVRSLQMLAPMLLLIHLTGGDWRLHCLEHSPRLSDLAVAFCLVISAYFAGDVLVTTADRAGINLYADQFHAGQNEQTPDSALVLFCVIVVSGLVNGLAEELVMRSWLIPKLEKLMKSSVVAVMFSSALFAMYHFYLGIAGVIQIFGCGIVFGFYFVYFKRFWPLAIAHAAMDVIPYYW